MSLSEVTRRRNPLLEYGFDGRRPLAEERLISIMSNGEVNALRKTKTLYGDIMAYALGMHSSDEFMDVFTRVQNGTMTLDKTALVKMAIAIDLFHTIREFDEPRHDIGYAKTMARTAIQANGNTGIAIAMELKYANPIELALIHNFAEEFARNI